jgi:hypothetical protein
MRVLSRVAKLAREEEGQCASAHALVGHEVLKVVVVKEGPCRDAGGSVDLSRRQISVIQ